MDRKFPIGSSSSSSGNARRTMSGKVRSSRRRPGCIRLFVCPTTGGRLEISVSPRETVLGLKAALARKLRVPPSRLTLIYKDKVLKDGCLLDYKIPDESHVTLLPNMESGLSLQQSDKSIMQALENLSETQVNDFLSGRAPLMLAIRMGEHMVFVQLQLSTLQSQNTHSQGATSRSSPTPSSSSSASASTSSSSAAATASAKRNVVGTGVGGGAALSGMTSNAATLLSQSGLSASALAEATRCLSQKLHRLQELNRAGASAAAAAAAAASSRPSNGHSTMTPGSRRSHPASLIPATASRLVPSANRNPAVVPTTSTAATAASPQTLMRLPARPSLPVLQENALPSPPPSPGAVIDSMKHMGKGVYTGTFSGTLDSSLQDGNGQPRRSVNTILHILNDLLVASPHSPPANGAKSSEKGASSSQAFPFNTPVQTPPSGNTPASTDNSDNEMLRGKMQRIQMMLAQRKEQRRNRRQNNAPYNTPKPTAHTESTPTTTSSSLCSPSSSAVTTPTGLSTSATAAASICNATSSTVGTNSSAATTPVSSHPESNGDGAYCKASIEQDTLAV